MNITSFIKRYRLPVSQGSALAGDSAGIHVRLRTWIALSVVGIVAIGSGATYWAYSQEMQVMRDKTWSSVRRWM